VRTYYRSADVLITDEVFAVREPVPMRFRLERLGDAQVVTDDVRVAHLLAACGMALTLLSAAVAVSWLDDVLDRVTVSMLGAVSAVAIAVRWRNRSCGVELRAIYGGDEVRLFRSADPAIFGAVRQGLARALENRADVAERA